MFQRIGLLVLAFVLILAAQTASAQVLVFSPHPVDEALFTAGVIYRARQNGQTVKVVVATNGDCASSTVGHVREQETIAAMGLLGLSPDDVIFLGYPDCGLRFLYYYYTGADAEFTSDAGFTRTYAYEGLGNTDYHKYIFGASANYSGFSIIQDLKTVLRNYKPQDIYTTSGWDASTDHWTFNFLLGEAILANMREDATFQPTLHDGFINAPCDGCDPSYRWPMPSFTPTTNFPAPPYLPTTPLAWSDVESVEVPSVMQSTSTSTNLK
jgi:LmbE family N-acetylglucosaminyl deacetylase